MQAENETEKLKIIIRGMKDEFRRYKERVKENEKRYREKTKREFIKNLLETLDALARAVQDLREGETKEGCEFLKKITGGKDKNLEMIYAGLLESYNVIPIAPEYGESFDDIKHTALEVIRDADYPENTIVKTVRAGYLFEDEIIRPAEVVISKGGGIGETTPIIWKKQKEREKQKSFYSGILDSLASRAFKEKINELKEKSGELQTLEKKFIEKEIELKRETDELADKAGEVREKESELKKVENDVIEREIRAGKYNERTVIGLLNDLFTREKKLNEREHTSLVNKENINIKFSELKNRENELNELSHQLKTIREEVDNKLSRLAKAEERKNELYKNLNKYEFLYDELLFRKAKLEEKCAKLIESIGEHEMKEKEYEKLNKKCEDLNKKLIKKIPELIELEEKESILKNRISALEKKMTNLIVENMKLSR